MKKCEGKMKRYEEIIMWKYEGSMTPIQEPWDLEKFRTLPGVVADL